MMVKEILHLLNIVLSLIDVLAFSILDGNYLKRGLLVLVVLVHLTVLWLLLIKIQ